MTTSPHRRHKATLRSPLESSVDDELAHNGARVDVVVVTQRINARKIVIDLFIGTVAENGEYCDVTQSLTCVVARRQQWRM
jgi:hypothetical protein